MKKILVTGANGLIGKRLIEKYSHKYSFIALVRSIPDIIIPNVRYVEIDFEKTSFSQLEIGSVDTIIHLAMSADYKNFPKSGLQIFDVNTKMTADLLHYAAQQGVRKFIYASSGGVYLPQAEILNEASPLRDAYFLNYYIQNKILGETLTLQYRELLDVNILRLFFPYGPYQKSHMFLPSLIDKIKNGLPIYDDFNNPTVITLTHVNDLVIALEKTISETQHIIYNIAGNERHTIENIGDAIANRLGTSLDIKNQVSQGVKSLIPDLTRMKTELYDPEISFERGLDDLLS